VSLTRLLAVLAFCGVLVMIAGIELAARRPGSKVPTLGELCAFVMGYRVGRLPVGRIALFGFWWWAGWHFFAR
jgi:hypothetical protein